MNQALRAHFYSTNMQQSLLKQALRARVLWRYELQLLTNNYFGAADTGVGTSEKRTLDSPAGGKLAGTASGFTLLHPAFR